MGRDRRRRRFGPGVGGDERRRSARPRDGAKVSTQPRCTPRIGTDAVSSRTRAAGATWTRIDVRAPNPLLTDADWTAPHCRGDNSAYVGYVRPYSLPLACAPSGGAPRPSSWRHASGARARGARGSGACVGGGQLWAVRDREGGDGGCVVPLNFNTLPADPECAVWVDICATR